MCNEGYRSADGGVEDSVVGEDGVARKERQAGRGVAEQGREYGIGEATFGE